MVLLYPRCLSVSSLFAWCLFIMGRAHPAWSLQLVRYFYFFNWALRHRPLTLYALRPSSMATSDWLIRDWSNPIRLLDPRSPVRTPLVSRLVVLVGDQGSSLAKYSGRLVPLRDDQSLLTWPQVPLPVCKLYRTQIVGPGLKFSS